VKHPMVMPEIKDSKTLAASPEISDRPRRRTFTARDKLRILGEADRAAGVPGALSNGRPYQKSATFLLSNFEPEKGEVLRILSP